MRRKSTVLTHGTPMLVTLMIVLPRTLAASPHARCQPRVVRSPAVHAPGVRSGRSCHTPSMAQRVNRYGRAGHGRAPSPRLRQPLRVWLRMVGFSHAPMPNAAYCESLRAMAVVRHARPAAHTLRVAVRAATVCRLSAHVRSSVQRGRQRLRCGVHPAGTACHRQARPGSVHPHARPTSATRSRHTAMTAVYAAPFTSSTSGYPTGS